MQQKRPNYEFFRLCRIVENPRLPLKEVNMEDVVLKREAEVKNGINMGDEVGHR